MIDLSLSKIIDQALDPLAIVWIVLLLAALKFWRLKAFKSSISLICFSLLVWCVGASPMSGILLSSLERPYVKTDPSSLDDVDAVVCLGGGMYAQPIERLSFTVNESCDRYLTAFDLIETGVAKHLVFGGSDYYIDGERTSEGLMLQRWRQRWQLTKGEIHLLTGSSNTRDEAESVGQLMQEKGWGKVALVTSAWHMNRSLAVFKNYGVEAIPVGCDFIGTTGVTKPYKWKLFPQALGMQSVHLYLHEIVGYYYYKLRGWI